MAKKETIELKKIEVKHAIVSIEGEGDLVLNKMNARTERELTEQRENNKTVRKPANMWEDIITAVHWKDDLLTSDTYNDCDQEMYEKLLKENQPCIPAFAFKKSFGQAVVRNEVDTYSTKFDNAVNVIANKGLIPVTFCEASVDKRLMSPKRGAPVLVYINHFSGWKAEFEIAYTENVYSLDQILNIINLAGFGLGIGSGRTSGYGRYHVTGVQILEEAKAA